MTSIAEAIATTAGRLNGAAGDDARLEAEVLLSHALGTDRTHLLARTSDTLDAATASAFDALVARRVAREPLAYIVGHREFYGLDFICTPRVLIPRPETEMLVDLAFEEISRRGAGLRILDVGTGSGAVAIAIAAHTPNTPIRAVDTSAEALDVARVNAARHAVADRVTFAEADLLDGESGADLIVANLPYISESEWTTLEPEVREHEPRVALVGGLRGTEQIERLIEQAAGTAPAAVLAAEIGETQGAQLLAFARCVVPDHHCYVMKDFAGRDRVLVIREEEGERA